jgi:hypothetical protein
MFDVFASEGSTLLYHLKRPPPAGADEGTFFTQCVLSVSSVIPVPTPADGSPAFSFQQVISTAPGGAGALPVCWIQYLDAAGTAPTLL